MFGLALPSFVGAQDLNDEFRRQVERGSFRYVETLLGNPEVDPNDPDEDGNVALMIAAEGDAPELVTLLIKADVNLDSQNNAGETALILAVRRGRVEAARLLLMAGADLSIRDSRGLSALDWAVEHKRTYLAQIIGIASRPSAANVIVSERPVTSGSAHLEPPKVIDETPPLYTEGAFERGIEGRVVLRVIIRKDGSVGAMRIHQSLDSDLDRAAIAAVEQWTFEPATIDGDPINVLADIEVDFHLQQSPL
jgi:TonB family protein